MSNGAIHHHVQLFPSTCSNRLSSSGLVTSFLVFLFSFSILPSIIVLRRESPLIMWPGQFTCWLRIIPISDFFHFNYLFIGPVFHPADSFHPTPYPHFETSNLLM